MKKTVISLVLALAMVISACSAFACTTIYAGSALTTDGSFFFARSEDYSNSYNKLFAVVKAGTHKAGEVYNGCYGFSYVFTKDSYGYTAFCDDNGEGAGFECPDCGSTHAHTPYQAAGTNEMGVSMTATETIGGNELSNTADPYEDCGIEEAEITTVILSEASTAKEGVELLLSIYDEAGACGGSGIIIADANEAWYIENVTGHEYIALKLNENLLFAQPNMSIIGLIDLDDTENVIASPKLIETAVNGGFFVGDQEKNQINYTLSYSAAGANARMEQILPYLTGNTYETVEDADYMLSNVNAEGSIVPLYSNIKAAKVLSIEDIVEFYHLSNIGTARATETHIFQICAPGATGTLEWVAVNDPNYNAFVPYLPMLTTEVLPAYGVSTLPAEKTADQPESGAFYSTTFRARTAEGPANVDGFCVLPEGWQYGWYWNVDALSHLEKTDDQKAAILGAIAELQNECYALAEQLKADGMDAETATKLSMDMAAKEFAVLSAESAKLIK